MIFQPVLHPLLILVIGIFVVAVPVVMLITQKGQRPVWVLRVLIAVACVAVLLRPGVPGGELQTLATDTDVVLVVDTTASITAEDWGENQPRLDGVRDDIRALVEAYPGARFALITFDSEAILRLPLTTDTSAVMSALDVMTPEVTAFSKGSSIGSAHALLVQTLQRAAEASPDRARMAFYFGDGEQTVSTNPETFAGAASYLSGGAVLGYGTDEGGPMLLTTGGVEQSDEYIEYQGAPALSVIDENNLRTLATQMDVGYQLRSAATDLDIPPAPSTTVAYRDAGTAGAVNDLSWIIALFLVALLGIEVAAATTRLVQLRRLAAAPADSAVPPDAVTAAAPNGGDSV